MAKNGGRGRIRVFFAEVEGDDETIQEGLQAINVAANKIFQSTPTKIVKVLPASATPIDEDELLEELEDEDEALAPPNVAMNSKPKKSSYKPPIMSIVKDLNLRPEGELSFRDFYAQKKPNTQEQAVTVAVYYLRRVLELDKITPEHVFTCFKDVGRRICLKLFGIRRRIKVGSILRNEAILKLPIMVKTWLITTYLLPTERRILST
jgi:hypothetical protein